MTRHSLFISILALSPLWILAAHAAAVRVGPGKLQGQKLAIAASAMASAPVGAALWAACLRSLEGPGFWGAVLYASATYILLAYSYFHLFNMSETARRVRVLVELGERGSLSLDELDSLYDTGGMLAARVARLVSLGQAAVEDGRMVLVSRRLYTAALVMDWWARVLGMPSFRGFHGGPGSG